MQEPWVATLSGPMKRLGLVGLALLGTVFAGCIYGEPNWRKVETPITSQPVESAPGEYLVSPLLPFEDLHDHIEAYRAAGWEVDKVSSAGKECPGMYLVTYRR